MAGLLSSDTVTNFTGQFGLHFNTFSERIVIYKESIKVISQTTNVALPGFPPETTDTQITYSFNSGIFSGIVIHPGRIHGGKGTFLQDKINLNENSTYIKVERPARDFIDNGGKTENIEIDGDIYNVGTHRQTQNYLNLRYYYIELIATN